MLRMTMAGAARRLAMIGKGLHSGGVGAVEVGAGRFAMVNAFHHAEHDDYVAVMLRMTPAGAARRLAMIGKGLHSGGVGAVEVGAGRFAVVNAFHHAEHDDYVAVMLRMTPAGAARCSAMIGKGLHSGGVGAVEVGAGRFAMVNAFHHAEHDDYVAVMLRMTPAGAARRLAMIGKGLHSDGVGAVEVGTGRCAMVNAFHHAEHDDYVAVMLRMTPASAARCLAIIGKVYAAAALVR